MSRGPHIYTVRGKKIPEEGLTEVAKDVLRLLIDFGIQYGYSVSQISHWKGYSRRKTRRILKQLERNGCVLRS